jgi:hypothetical protein
VVREVAVLGWDLGGCDEWGTSLGRACSGHTEQTLLLLCLEILKLALGKEVHARGDAQSGHVERVCSQLTRQTKSNEA